MFGAMVQPWQTLLLVLNQTDSIPSTRTAFTEKVLHEVYYLWMIYSFFLSFFLLHFSLQSVPTSPLKHFIDLCRMVSICIPPFFKKNLIRSQKIIPLQNSIHTTLVWCCIVSLVSISSIYSILYSIVSHLVCESAAS